MADRYGIEVRVEITNVIAIASAFCEMTAYCEFG